MAETTYFRFMTDLNWQNPPAIFVLHGFYEFLGEAVIRELSTRVLKERTDFNYRRFYFDSDDDSRWEEIISETRSANFFLAGKKLVVVTLRQEKHCKLDKADKALIDAYIATPNPNTALVIYVSLDLTKDDYKQFRKTKFASFVKNFESSRTLTIDLDKASEGEIKQLIKSHMKARGLSISAQALEKLIEIKGDDIHSIIQQLPKLELAAHAGSQTLDTVDIEELITGISPHSIWDLTEAIETEDPAAYLNTLKYLAINGIKPLFIIGTLISYYHKIYTAKFLLKHNFPVADIGRVLQQPSFFLGKFIAMVNHISEHKIDEILKLIYKLDFESKTSGEESARLSLQTFIFQIKKIRNF
jgi:DNA polymerase III delta subunit